VLIPASWALPAAVNWLSHHRLPWRLFWIGWFAREAAVSVSGWTPLTLVALL
jgi:hypothetical protein